MYSFQEVKLFSSSAHRFFSKIREILHLCWCFGKHIMAVGLLLISDKQLCRLRIVAEMSALLSLSFCWFANANKESAALNVFLLFVIFWRSWCSPGVIFVGQLLLGSCTIVPWRFCLLQANFVIFSKPIVKNWQQLWLDFVF